MGRGDIGASVKCNRPGLRGRRFATVTALCTLRLAPRDTRPLVIDILHIRPQQLRRRPRRREGGFDGAANFTLRRRRDAGEIGLARPGGPQRVGATQDRVEPALRGDLLGGPVGRGVGGGVALQPIGFDEQELRTAAIADALGQLARGS